MDAIRHLREDVIPAVAGNADVFVGGQTATTMDLIDQTSDYTPVVFAVVLGLSFVLLTIAFRSVVIPGKAIAMNLLSVGAAYVVVFQQGPAPSG